MKKWTLLILVFSALVGGVAYAEEKNEASLLKLVCEPNALKDGSCGNAKEYPNASAGQSCNIQITPNSLYEGHFMGPSSNNILLANYSSDCEAHVNEWGGELVFEQEGKRYLFKGYLSGKGVSDCKMSLGKGDKDKLFCITGSMHQGHLEETVSEIIVSRDIEGKVDTTFDVYAYSDENDGAFGVDAIECDGKEKFINFEWAKNTLATAPLTVTAHYADAPLAEKLCANQSAKKEGWHGEMKNIPADMVELKEPLEGRFIVDDKNHRLVKN